MKVKKQLQGAHIPLETSDGILAVSPSRWSHVGPPLGNHSRQGHANNNRSKRIVRRCVLSPKPEHHADFKCTLPLSAKNLPSSVCPPSASVHLRHS